MSAESTDDPVIHCPECDKEWSDGSAFEMKQGSQAECPGCGATIECIQTDIQRSWIWGKPTWGPGRTA